MGNRSTLLVHRHVRVSTQTDSSYSVSMMAKDTLNSEQTWKLFHRQEMPSYGGKIYVRHKNGLAKQTPRARDSL